MRSYFDRTQRPLIGPLHGLQRQVLVHLQTFLALMTRDQLNLGVGESARGEKGEHLVPKQMRVHRLRDARSMAILLYDLLDAARSERAAAPGLKEIAVARIGPQMALQDQAEAGWKQNVAILAPLPWSMKIFAWSRSISLALIATNSLTRRAV